MEHAMNEKMREMVGKGELSEASYKKLVDELGRQKEEADAPLFEVTYTANMIMRTIDHDDDDGIDYAMQSCVQPARPKRKIVRGVTKHAARLFAIHADHQFARL